MVTGPGGQYCKGSKKAYPPKRLRYNNCYMNKVRDGGKRSLFVFIVINCVRYL